MHRHLKAGTYFMMAGTIWAGTEAFRILMVSEGFTTPEELGDPWIPILLILFLVCLGARSWLSKS